MSAHTTISRRQAAVPQEPAAGPSGMPSTIASVIPFGSRLAVPWKSRSPRSSRSEAIISGRWRSTISTSSRSTSDSGWFVATISTTRLRSRSSISAWRRSVTSNAVPRAARCPWNSMISSEQSSQRRTPSLRVTCRS